MLNARTRRGYGLDILVYSGDDDSQCATVGTQDWIWSLGYEVSISNSSVYIIYSSYLQMFGSTCS
jgi:hypothetical protein